MSPLSKEAWVQFRRALPIAVANLLQRSLTWITWSFVGHLGADFLGPVTLASGINNVLGTSVVGGLAVGTSTLASQAFGAKDYVALGRVLQRAILIGLMGSLPCAILLCLLKPMLVWCGMDEIFVQRAGYYALTVLPVTPCLGVQRSIATWLAAQNITLPRLLVQLAALPLHATLTWFFVFKTPLHYMGAGVAMSLSGLAQLVMIYAYLNYSATCARSWKGFQKDVLTDWQPYLQAALPGVFMNAEYFVGEALTLAAARLPNPAVCLSALSIYQLTQVTCYQFPSGVRLAVSARVGNHLGAGDTSSAEQSQRAGRGLILLWICFPTTVLLTFTNQWGQIFTTDNDVLDLLKTLVLVMLLYSDADALLAYQNGILTACGQQKLSGQWAIRTYVFLGLPLALFLAFALQLGALGLVLGHSVGKLCHLAACTAGVCRIDWEHEGHAAAQRVQRLSQPVLLSQPLSNREQAQA
eukprot:TRINITY_DN21674_c0_g1_i1.p1 TRINITY_DN21674_c0_g1~~TRINITY_DN21674_c0_g1_i1.p1  ORF type:complete len:469 (+),score=64.03 TRINITY_DN21674_c0_g1_i1:112-1518(+)